jgi:hypothetical protein
MSTLEIKLVRGSNGKIDQDASLIAAETAIAAYCVQRELELETVSESVHAVFDKLNGGRGNMPYVVNQVLNALNVEPANYNALKDLVEDFLRTNANEDRTSGAMFKIGKGKGGGVTRWSDQSETQE